MKNESERFTTSPNSPQEFADTAEVSESPVSDEDHEPMEERPQDKEAPKTNLVEPSNVAELSVVDHWPVKEPQKNVLEQFIVARPVGRRFPMLKAFMLIRRHVIREIEEQTMSDESDGNDRDGTYTEDDLDFEGEEQLSIYTDEDLDDAGTDLGFVTFSLIYLYPSMKS